MESEWNEVGGDNHVRAVSVGGLASGKRGVGNDSQSGASTEIWLRQINPGDRSLQTNSQ